MTPRGSLLCSPSSALLMFLYITHYYYYYYYYHYSVVEAAFGNVQRGVPAFTTAAPRSNIMNNNIIPAPWQEGELRQRQTSQRSQSRFLRHYFAIIYGNDDGVGGIMEEEDDSTTSNNNNNEVLLLLLQQSLTAQLDPVLLTRVACAFAPPPHTQLHPNNVLSAALVGVDSVDGVDVDVGDRREQPQQPRGAAVTLQVALAVPQDRNSNVCIQILVPIVLALSVDTTTTTSSSSSTTTSTSLVALEQQIIAALEQLEEQALQRIASQEEQMQDKDDYENQANHHQAMILQQQMLQEEPYADSLPDWWTFPELSIFTLADECTNLKSLLNEDDFIPDLKQLVRVYYYYKKNDEIDENENENEISSSSSSMLPISNVQQVRVAMVGPAGLFLRAMIVQEQEQRATSAGTTATKMVEVAIPFPQPTKTADDLRDSVLDLVESTSAAEAEAFATAAATAAAVEEAPLVLPPAEQEEEEEEEEEAPVVVVVQEEEVAPELASSSASQSSSRTTTTTTTTTTRSSSILQEARRQPKSPEEEARLAAKYAAISDLGERAYCILKDLYMI